MHYFYDTGKNLFITLNFKLRAKNVVTGQGASLRQCQHSAVVFNILDGKSIAPKPRFSDFFFKKKNRFVRRKKMTNFSVA